MSRQGWSGVTLTCNAKDCGTSESFWGGKKPEEAGWGIVRVYDEKIDRNVIGYENGWSNFDLCPECYKEQMGFLGIEPHNIPTMLHEPGTKYELGWANDAEEFTEGDALDGNAP